MKKVKWKCATLLAVGLLCCFSPALAQSDEGAERVTIAGRNVPFEKVLKEIYKQTGLKAVYDPKDLKIIANDDWDAHKVPVGEILRHALGGQLPYIIKGGKIIINMKLQLINGSVTDAETGEPLIGATVLDRELSRKGSITDERGHFRFGAYVGTNLTFSYMGYEAQVIKIVSGKTHYDIKLRPESGKELKEVVVTGIVNRKANSFTGSVSSFSSEDLQKVGSQNVIKSLEALEPSMLQVTNLAAGSNPNAMPTLELNGTSSFPDVTGQYTGNPNQPLFILNGFESTLQSILDLDMNLVKSVTILKDASAKAIYGSKAANGVVIVETKRPKAGKVQVYYNGGATLEVPDLTSYNLANASEKLQAELLSGQVYDNGYTPSDDVAANTVYNNLYKEVMRGVNTYWLSVPLRVGVGQKHTVSIDGGNNAYIYGLDLSYNKITGAMKGSDRATLSGNVSLEYRIKNLAVQNILYVNYNNQNDPYHSFSSYAAQNPYWRKTDENGKPVKTFYSVPGTTYYNPLWDDQWKAYNKTNYTEITDNFNVDWTIYKTLRLVGRFNFTKNNSQSTSFRSPSLTEFYNAENKEKGSMTKGEDNTFTMGGDLNLTYSHTISNDHLLFYNIGTSFQTSSNDGYAFSAYGFPDDTDYLEFAQGYKTDDKPSASEGRERELSFLGIFNYSFQDRYLLDASIRTTGSSTFGRNKRWGTFWSTGLGWNVHNEPLIRDHEIGKALTLLKLRGSIGYSGAQNFSAYQTLPMYTYYSQYYYNGSMGSYLQAFPNTDLQWQSKNDQNVGVDLSLWNKINLTANYYISTTKNSISQLTVAPSIGFSSYSENIGDIQNKGFDLNLSYLVFNISATRSYLSLNFSVASNTNKILKISDAMRKYNEQVDAQKSGNATVGSSGRDQYTRPVARYVEGRSLTAIWGVRSAGIDPLNGKEVYIKQNGEKTYEWNANDQVVIGDARPKAHGTFGFSFEWKGFSLNTVCAYQMGGDYYNTTLIDKVENADIHYNVDKRYLYDRWKQPGDVSFFKDIADGNYTKPTSRFVMKNNQLAISTINVGYDFRFWKFVKRLGLTTLKLSAYINDVAIFSTVKQERGTDYPFARNMNFSLTLNF